MSISWKEILNRYLYFKTSSMGDESPPSITSNLDTLKPNDYDINFRHAIQDMVGDEAGIPGGFGGTDYISWIAGAEQSKTTRVGLYREMELNAWVEDGLTEYVSTALNADEKGNTIFLKIKNEDLSNNNNIRDNLQKEFDHITQTVFNYNLAFSEWFREFVLMGEVAIELLIPNDNVDIRTEGIKGVKLLRSE